MEALRIIELGDYQLYVGNIWKELSRFVELGSYSKIAILIDENTSKYCLPILQKELPTVEFNTIEIPSGETHKTIQTCTNIWKQMMQLALDRHSLLINLGGGVIGDMGGFCAATFKRGMSFIQLPTTLLAQVDASIGGKLGIDFAQIKNSIGLFQNPQAVFIDPIFLKTLPYEELRSGFAEIIKHGLIADVNLWNDVSAMHTLDPLKMEELIYRSLLIKKEVVAQDPYEKGLRKILNFGHTIGHALESNALGTDAPLLHGEAIAIGMICESYLSQVYQEMSMTEAQKIADYFLNIYGKYSIDENAFVNLLDLMSHDKKNIGDTINFTFLNQPGSSVFDCTSSKENIIESLRYYNTLTS